MLNLKAADADLIAKGQALLAEAPATQTTDPRAWLLELPQSCRPAPCLAMVEHLFGVLPLIHQCWASVDSDLLRSIEDGTRLAGLALFTPTPDFDGPSTALDGELDGDLMRLSGRVRVASRAATAALALVRWAEDEYRLVCLDRPDDSASSGGPTVGWWNLDGVTVQQSQASEPVAFGTGDVLAAALDDYASVYALVASAYAEIGARALRCAARTTSVGAKAFNKSQMVRFEIVGLEVQADLASCSARNHFDLEPDDASRVSGWTLAASSVKAMVGVAEATVALRDRAGLEIEGFDHDEDVRCPNLFLGGPLRVESELAQGLGL